MSNKSVQRGHKRVKRPGTCNQTGNSAPRIRWPASVRVLIACIAYHLDYTDDSMGRLRDFPPSADQYKLFNRLLPWFGQWYDSAMIKAAKDKGYPINKLNLFKNGFGPTKVHNRLLYLFTEPGKKKHSPHPRLYGISVEHHDSTEQHKPGGRAYVFAKCSSVIMRRLKLGGTISQKEIQEWSNVS